MLKTRGDGFTYWADDFSTDPTKVAKPTINSNGTAGQILKTNGDGTTTWSDSDPIQPAEIASAVEDWFEGHPEVTTTLSDGSVTKTKLASSLAAELDGKASAIIGNYISRVHENTNKVTFIGNAYAWGNARYANRENYIKLPDTSAVTLNGVTITSQDGFAFFNGAATGSNDGSKFEMSVDIPAGTYTFTVEPYLGNGEVTKGKNMHLDFFYDGNTSYTQDKRATVEAAGLADKSVTVTTTAHTYKLKLWRSVGANTYDDYRLFYSLFASDVTITDTEQTVINGATLEYTLPAEIAVIDTMQHKSSVQSILDTKDYADSKVPKPVTNPNGSSGQILQSNGDGSTVWIDYSADLGYLTPEMYGAYGDGSHDDYQALQACIDAAQAGSDNNKCKAIRGYGKYKIGTGIVIHAREISVWINHLVYTGADGAAVTISAIYSKFYFNDIRCENESGYDFATDTGTLPVGIRCTTYSGSTAKMYDAYSWNELECRYIKAGNNCLEIVSPVNETSIIMYNVFRFGYMWSKYRNCIYQNSNVANEIDYYGKIVEAMNGYAFYNAGNQRVYRLHGFCFEAGLKNAAFGMVSMENCRCAEMINRKSIDNPDIGYLYTFDGVIPRGDWYNTDNPVDLTCVNVTNALTFSGFLDLVKARIDEGAVSSWDAFQIYAFSIKPYMTLEHCTRSANANMLQDGGMRCVVQGTMIVYYRNIALKPDSEVYCQVNGDMTIQLTSQNNYDYLTPTTFDINTALANIQLDASYCPIAIDEFDLIQYDDKKAKVYDRAGNLIFDGTSLGAGVYHFTCNFVPLASLSVTSQGGRTMSCPAGLLKAIYTGECSGAYNTEKWTIKRQELITVDEVISE